MGKSIQVERRVWVLLLVALSTGCFSQPTPPLSTQIEIRGRRAQVTAFLAQHPIRFVPGRVELRSSSLEALDSLARLLAATPDVGLMIDGFAHSQNSAHLNQELSAFRAEGVRLYLAVRGVSADRMRARGHGSAKPGATAASGFDARLEPQVALSVEGR